MPIVLLASFVGAVRSGVDRLETHDERECIYWVRGVWLLAPMLSGVANVWQGAYGLIEYSNSSYAAVHWLGLFWSSLALMGMMVSFAWTWLKHQSLSAHLWWMTLWSATNLTLFAYWVIQGLNNLGR